MTPRQRQQMEGLLEEQRRLADAVEAHGRKLRRFLAEAESEPEPAMAPPPPPPLPPLPKPPEVPRPAAVDPVKLPPPKRFEASVAPPAEPRGEAASHGSLEMTLGTVWLARIGIVILLTGFVFVGNYAWQYLVPLLGPGGKVALLYLAAGVVGGAGAWLQRRPVSTGRYPQVLMAGGAATAYYTTYAAHFVRPLRVIESPLVGGLLLLAVAGEFLWWCERRKLQTAALLGLALSYYTSAINPIGEFTLYSSVLLTAAAGFHLVRNGWALVSWMSLAGTYLSFAFWRFHEVATARSWRVEPPWALAIWLLGAYWVIFTASVFLARRAALPAYRRAAFLTLNNALFFGLATEHLLARNPQDTWGFAQGFGLVLLALAGLARRRSVEDYALDGAYLAQGLAAVTAGLAMKLSGPSLAVSLAVESAVLLSAVTRRHGAIYRVGAVSVAVWSFCLTFDRMNAAPETILPLGGTVAALLLFDAWWLKQRSGWLAGMTWSTRAAGFAALGLALVFFILTQQVHAPWEPPSLAVAALVATVSIYPLRLPEVVLLGQLYLVAAAALWWQEVPGIAPWWSPLPILAVALALAHWWQRQRHVQVPRETLHAACALVGVATAYQWAVLHTSGERWVITTSCAGAAALLYGYATRAWAVALLGQVFAISSVAAVVSRFGAQHFGEGIALLPLVGVAVTLVVLVLGKPERWSETRPPALAPVAVCYGVLAFALSVSWVFEYVPAYWQLLVLAIAGALLLMSAARWPSRGRRAAGLAFFAVAFVAFWLRDFVPGLPDLLAFLLAPASLRIARRFRSETAPEIASAITAITTASVWLWVTRLLHAHGKSDLLTLAWSALAVAVFVAGLTLRDRIYRIGGFAILALAIGRIFLVDIWRLETLYRILSFLGLGIALLVLGFVYNRYADRIRRWL